MVYMLEKLFHNADLDIGLASSIDDKQNIWFKGKDIALILGYSDTDQALRIHVDDEDKFKGPVVSTGLFPKRASAFSRSFYGLFPKRSATYFHK